MATRTGWLMGLALLGSAVSANAMAADPLGFNPLGLYAGAGLGQSYIDQTQFDEYGNVFHHIDGQPLGWNAVLGIRPIPILGAEAEFIDFGNKRVGGGSPYYTGGNAQQFLGGETHDRAGALFAVGYLPLGIPWVEAFAKLGWAQLWDHDSYSGIYTPGGQVSVSQTTHANGAAYGAGLQFRIEQLAVRAQYERISGQQPYGGWTDPSLLSVGLNWTF